MKRAFILTLFIKRYWPYVVNKTKIKKWPLNAKIAYPRKGAKKRAIKNYHVIKSFYLKGPQLNDKIFYE